MIWVFQGSTRCFRLHGAVFGSILVFQHSLTHQSLHWLNLGVPGLTRCLDLCAVSVGSIWVLRGLTRHLGVRHAMVGEILAFQGSLTHQSLCQLDLGVLGFNEAFRPSCCFCWLDLGVPGFIDASEPLWARFGCSGVRQDIWGFMVLWLARF